MFAMILLLHGREDALQKSGSVFYRECNTPVTQESIRFAGGQYEMHAACKRSVPALLVLILSG